MYIPACPREHAVRQGVFGGPTESIPDGSNGLHFRRDRNRRWRVVPIVVVVVSVVHSFRVSGHDTMTQTRVLRTDGAEGHTEMRQWICTDLVPKLVLSKRMFAVFVSQHYRCAIISLPFADPSNVVYSGSYTGHREVKTYLLIHR